MSKCPACKIGDLIERETEASVLLECSRRGKRREDRKCDYVQRYDIRDKARLARDEELWNKAVAGVGSRA